ncbi:MAG: ABC transporter permease [Gammaproteobacteria bacterium]
MLGLIERVRSLLHSEPALVPLTILAVSVAAFGVVLGSRFLSPFTLSLILQQVMIVGLVGAAQTLVVLTAGIDLSGGAIMVLTSVVMGHCAVHYGWPTPLAILAGFALGAALGCVNGWLVARMKLQPFIVTLATWQIVLATNFLYSGNESIRSQVIEAQAPLLQLFGRPLEVAGASLTLGAGALVGLVALLSYVLRHTAWGRHVYAIGDDADAAELAGVQVRRTLISVYVLAGVICALAGWVLIGRVGSVAPTSGQFANIESITAVVIGGVSLFGGRGSIFGMLFGSLIVGVFGLGLRIAGADPQWTYLLIGVLILAAVSIDRWIRGLAA